MASLDRSLFRSELLERRARLESVRISHADSEDIARLLGEVDAALERMSQGSYGLCAVCHDPIEKDRLIADPLTTICIDHFNAGQRRALEEDLELAVRIQTKLLPERGLSGAGWVAHYQYQPAGPVSGDFCDVVPCDGDRLFFILGDVAGKGVAASLLMSHIHATFRTLLSVDTPIEEMLTRANRLFCMSTMPSHYATAACGFAHASGDVEICNAGHCPPLVLRNSGVEAIEATGIPLGLFCEGRYGASRMRLAAGESMLLYTDGLTEARGPSDDEYGMNRLVASLRKCRDLPPEKIAAACLEDLGAFLAGNRRADDLTMLVIRRA